MSTQSDPFNAAVEQARLSAERVSGRIVNNFFCPILYRDEDAPLCKAHVINQAFSDSDRTWVVQRADVDNYFGTIVESEFVKLEERDRHSLMEVLRDKRLRKMFRPKILRDSIEVPHYTAKDGVPPMYSNMILEDESASTNLVLKLPRAEVEQTAGRDWSVEMEADLKLPALVSLIKAAHLSFFAMLGYEYVFSPGAYFVGRVLLGEFFLQSRQLDRGAALELAWKHFSPYANLVRPIEVLPPTLQGTVSDKRLFICLEGDKPWGALVIVRTGRFAHAVLLPTLREDWHLDRFMAFLDAGEQVLSVRFAEYKGDRWDVAPDTTDFSWPESGLDDS